MANQQLFNTQPHQNSISTLTHNEAGGIAYSLSAKQQLAQLAATACFGQTYYAEGQTQLEQILALCAQLDTEFIAKVAIYSAHKAYLKDVPALLLAVLAARQSPYFSETFTRIITNGKMLRNFVQIMRSGATGRQSLGTLPKKLIQQWLTQATEKQLLNAAIGNKPSLADIIRMVHPKPTKDWHSTWFAWAIGKKVDVANLPDITRAFEHYKKTPIGELPDVPFFMLTSLELSQEQWQDLALKMSWSQLRQGLNMLARHQVFEQQHITEKLAHFLASQVEVLKAQVMPYQLLAAYRTCHEQVPELIKTALAQAMEYAITNTPSLDAKVIICPDVSGSMCASITGYRGSATSRIRCVDVAGLIASALLRKNPEARLLPFDTQIRELDINPQSPILHNSEKFAEVCGGGTAVSAPIAQLNQEKASADMVIIISDNESWADIRRNKTKTALMHEWAIFKKRCPHAKLVCLDIQPSTTSPAHQRKDILNIGGFNDQVFDIIRTFLQHDVDNENYWVNEIEKISLESHH